MRTTQYPWNAFLQARFVSINRQPPEKISTCTGMATDKSYGKHQPAVAVLPLYPTMQIL